ncbi:MAG: TonB-dependent receptor [Tangfeifania sp.]
MGNFYALFTPAFKSVRSSILITGLLLIGIELPAQTSSEKNNEISVLEKKTGTPVQFAHIKWQVPNNKNISGFDVTDKQGTFKIKTNNTGQVLISVSCVGYKPLTDTIEITKKNTIYLEKDVLNLEQVVVTGTRTPKRLADVPVQTTVIQETDIRKAAAVSPLEILQDNVPGLVSTANAMGNNLRMRGLNSRYILFLVDGERLVSEGSGGNINLDQIDFNTIERIEVVNGAASALYGSNAVGAVINIITKKPVHKFEGSFNTSYQNHNTSRVQANIGSNLNKTSIGASLFRNNTNGYDIDGGAMSKPHTDYGSDVKVGIKPTERLTVNLNGRLFQHEIFNFSGTLNTAHDLERKVTLGGKSVLLSKNNRNHLTASINYDKFFKFDVLERKDDLLEKQNDITYVSGRLINTCISEKQWELVSGLEYNFEGISTAGSAILGPEPTEKNVGDVNAFLQWQNRFLKKLEAVLGSRYTYNEQFGSAFSPKLSLMYKTGPFTFRGGTGTAFRAPALKELYYNFNHNGSFWVYGNPDLVPEKGLYNSLSAEYTKGMLNMSLTGYYNRIKNKITTYRIISEIGQPDRYYRNVSSSTLQGFDVNISYVWLQQLVVKSTYSFSNARDNNTGLQLTGNVKHSATCAITWNHEVFESPFSFQFSGRITSPILNEFTETDENGNEVILKDASKSYNIWKATFIKPFRINEHMVELTLKCDNLFNFSDIYFTNPGRQYLVGLRYKFR